MATPIETLSLLELAKATASLVNNDLEAHHPTKLKDEAKEHARSSIDPA